MKRVMTAAPATSLLIGACLIVYLIEIILGGMVVNAAVLVRLGANFAVLLREGQWWRLISAAFLHVGPTHLIVNMIVLYYIGMYVERLCGHWRFLVIYFSSVLLGNLMSAAAAPMAISAGASTGIFGLFGAFLLLGEEFRQMSELRGLARQYLILMVINFIFDILVPGIDLYGHLGGLIGGFLMGAIVGAPKLGRISLVKRFLAGMVVLLIAGLLVKVVFV